MTAGVVDEDRDGGSMPGRTLFDGTTFAETLHTTRVDGGAVGQVPLADDRIVSGRCLQPWLITIAHSVRSACRIRRPRCSARQP